MVHCVQQCSGADVQGKSAEGPGQAWSVTFPRGPSQPPELHSKANPRARGCACNIHSPQGAFSCEPDCFAIPSVLLASVRIGRRELHSLRVHRGKHRGGRDGGKLLRSEGGWRGSFWERTHCISQSSHLQNPPKMANRGHITVVLS